MTSFGIGPWQIVCSMLRQFVNDITNTNSFKVNFRFAYRNNQVIYFGGYVFVHSGANEVYLTGCVIYASRRSITLKFALMGTALFSHHFYKRNNFCFILFRSHAK